MSLRVDKAAGQKALHALQGTLERQARTMARLASQKRIATASDDPAGLAIARRLEAAVRGMGQGERNVADGQGLVRTAEASLQSSQDALVRMRELTVQAQNGTLSAEDRATIQAEYDQLSQQVDQTAAGAHFGDRALLDGSMSGQGALVVADGRSGGTAVEVPDLRASALGVSGRDVAAASTVDALDDAMSRVSSVRSQLGAVDTRLGHQAAELGAARSNAEEARSRIEDADLAREVAAMTRDRILQGLQLAGVKIAGRSHRAVLDLLG